MLKRKSGYTLIEYILVIVVIGILFAVLAPIMKAGLDAHFFVRARTDVVSEARLAMERMVREIRQADQVAVFTATECRFVDIKGEDIRFWQDGNSLKRNDNVFIDNLANGGLDFVYTDQDGNPAFTADAIKRVGITLIINTSSGNFTMQSASRLYNR